MGLVALVVLVVFHPRLSEPADEEKLPSAAADEEKPPSPAAGEENSPPPAAGAPDEKADDPLSRGDPTIPGSYGRMHRGASPPPPPPAQHSDPDRSHGGYDIWMTEEDDGKWSVPVNLGPHINTSLRESAAVVTHDGDWLYFSSRDRPDSFGREDIYVCAREGKGWGPPINLDATHWSKPESTAVNTIWEEQGACPFPDGKMLMFCRMDPVQKTYDFAVTVRDEQGWLEAIGFGRPLATGGEERHPSVTRDGRHLFFTANWRGEGSYDIWQSYRDDRGNWEEPVNLGPRVNSPGSDYSPGISPDGKRLFFASRQASETTFDIFVTERKEGGTWGERVRLPSPVNTRFDEYCPSVAPDGKTLYFTSDRSNGLITESEEEE
jgi:Tol biopolymer transport system component